MIKIYPTHISRSRGFTLIELMIVVAVIGVLAAIAYPSYQRYVIKSHRADTMSEMQNIAGQIEARKLSSGSYSATGLTGSFPRQGTALYNIAITPTPLTKDWTITATPITATVMATDGILTLDSSGRQCRNDIGGVITDDRCGAEWN